MSPTIRARYFVYILFAVNFSNPIIGHAQNQTPAAPSIEPIIVRARALRGLESRDKTRYHLTSTQIDQPISDASLAESLRKLPGVVVRSTSGLGSATTVIAPNGLGSGATQVNVDGMPIVETSGRGLNFSLFPATLIESIGLQSPFATYGVEQSSDVPVSALSPVGRIQLQTLGQSFSEELAPQSKPQVLAAVQGGSANSGEATVAVATQRWSLALTGFRTKGDFHFRNPDSDTQNLNRLNNDAWGLGSVQKGLVEIGSKSTLHWFHFISHGDRTNPGLLNFPAAQKQRDFFDALGAQIEAPQLFSNNTGLVVRTSTAVSRIATRGPAFPGGDLNETADARSLGNYTQVSLVTRPAHHAMAFSIDAQNDGTRKDEGYFHRHVYGATASWEYLLKPQNADLRPSLEWRPFATVRAEVAPQYQQSSSFAYDGFAGLKWGFSDRSHEWLLATGRFHTFPTISALSGFSSSGFEVAPNPNLRLQQDYLTEASYVLRAAIVEAHLKVFYDRIFDRATFVNGATQAQFVNAPSVSIVGTTVDAQWFVSQVWGDKEAVTLRHSLTWTKAIDTSTKRDLPYKPRLEGYVSVAIQPHKYFSFMLEEQFLSKRFTSLDPENDFGETLQPLITTNLRFNLQILSGTAFLRLQNIFDVARFESPGFPYPGRSVWLGYAFTNW